jgi:hypothetical protein
MKLYTSTAVTDLINKYTDKGGNITELSEGVLGHGSLILHGEGLKTAIVNEVFLNEWSSGHTVRFYNKTPKKYSNLL